MNPLKIIGSFALVLCLANCKQKELMPDPNTPTIPTIPAITMNNVAYGPEALQTMDVYLPANRSTATTKYLVMIHGGSWITGDKLDLISFVDTLKRRLPDYAIINLNYRLSAAPVNVFPTQENDVKTAIDFILSKSSSYLISNKYVILGASAGGHLAMLQAYKNSGTNKPKVVVSFFGISNMADLYNNPVGGNPLIASGVAAAVGKTPMQDPAIYTSSSPINFISAASSQPTIFLHGGLDPLVSPNQSTTAQAKLTSVGVANQYVFYPTGGHGDWDNATYADAFTKVEAFLRLYVL